MENKTEKIKQSKDEQKNTVVYYEQKIRCLNQNYLFKTHKIDMTKFINLIFFLCLPIECAVYKDTNDP